MVATAANFVITICLLVALYAFVRSVWHQWAKRGTSGGMILNGLLFATMIGLTVLVALLRDAMA